MVIFAAMPQNGPRISGGESVYHVGDRVQVNCTSDKSHPAAELRWYINGQQVDKKQRFTFYNLTPPPKKKEETAKNHLEEVMKKCKNTKNISQKLFGETMITRKRKRQGILC